MKTLTAALLLTLALTSTAAQGASLLNGDIKSQKRHSATFHYGLLTNSSAQDASLLRYMAAGFTVSTGLARRMLLDGPVDFLSAEAGAFFYRVADLIPDGGDTVVLPLRGTFRYGVQLSSRAEFSAYLGAMTNFAFGGGRETRQRLTQTMIAVGVTASVAISDWLAARLDAGNDLIGLGLTVLF